MMRLPRFLTPEVLAALLEIEDQLLTEACAGHYGVQVNCAPGGAPTSVQVLSPTREYRVPRPTTTFMVRV